MPKKGTCSSKLKNKHHHRNKHIQISLVFKIHLIGRRQYIECKFELLLKTKNYIYFFGTVESKKTQKVWFSLLNRVVSRKNQSMLTSFWKMETTIATIKQQQKQNKTKGKYSQSWKHDITLFELIF